MRKVIIYNAVIKGYHEFQIHPPPLLCLQVTKEYGNKHDKNACLVCVPELESIPREMWNTVTDTKRGEVVETIAGLPIGYARFLLLSRVWSSLHEKNGWTRERLIMSVT